MEYRLDSEFVERKARECLAERGVTVEDIAELVYFLQKDYIANLKMEDCLYSAQRVVHKREVQNAVLTGIYLDTLCEKGLLPSPLQEMIRYDEGLYGVDEVLALSIINLYGTIGFTNFGYIDKKKPGILGRLNDKNNPQVHTFLDDLIAAIASAASSRLAHKLQPDV